MESDRERNKQVYFESLKDAKEILLKAGLPTGVTATNVVAVASFLAGRRGMEDDGES